MAFKLRLQIFFLILTVLPLLVGGWMIQRTVVESRRSSIDQRLAGGVGTLGAQYAAVLVSGKRVLATLPSNSELQKAIADKDSDAVRERVELAPGDVLRITVKDASGKLIAGTRRPMDAHRHRAHRQRPLLATVAAYADISALIAQAELSDKT